MAARNLTREITVQEESWGNIYTGPREALVAAGIADAAKFPGDPGNNKTSQRYLVNGARRRIERAAGGAFRVLADHDQATQLANLQAEKQRRAREAALSEAAAMPTSREEFRARLRQSADRYVFVFTGMANTGLGGYRVDPDSMYEIRMAALRLMEALDEAAIVFSPEARDRERALILEQSVGEDPAFTRFLERATTAPIDPDEPA